MRKLVAWTLRRRGHDVVECDNGSVLLHVIDILACNHRCIDLVISDLRMPELGGLEALDRIRQNQKSTPLIVMTAFPEVDARVEASRLNVAGFLEKPFELERLCSLVDELLGEWR